MNSSESPETPSGSSDAPSATTTAEKEPVATKPAPVPWTPELALEWNRYYDLYVMAGVLMLVFFASALSLSNPSVWPLLRAGEETIDKLAPVVTDTYSYTATGKRWVNIPWLFEVVNAGVYRIASRLVPVDPKTGITTDAAKALRFGASAMVLLTAVVRVLAAALLLSLRKAGPGLWWTSLCVALAFGGVLCPFGFTVGGIAAADERVDVSPEIWGLLFLSIEMVMLDRAIDRGKRAAAWGIVPLFLVWANFDESFLYGLAVLLLAAAAGPRIARRISTRETVDKTTGSAWVWTRKDGLIVFAAAAAVCLANPSFFRLYSATVSSYVDIFASKHSPLRFEQISIFGNQSARFYYEKFFPDKIPLLGSRGLTVLQISQAFFFVTVGAGLGSFYLNRDRFHLGRFLTFVFATIGWAVLTRRLAGPFAVVYASTLALNGQEWYLDRFGAKGRTSRGWTLWSTGGRAMTIVAIFGFVAQAITGYGPPGAARIFGLGVDQDRFAFEAADYLAGAKIDGRVLNLSLELGDAIVWKTPNRKSYIDSRRHLFPKEVFEEVNTLRDALSQNAPGKWKPILDARGVTVLMVSPMAPADQGVYLALKKDPGSWVPFHDDGVAALFGRTDAPAADLKYFKEHRLDADDIVYRRQEPIRSTFEPPSEVHWIDAYYRLRALTPPQPHVEVARRWLSLMESGEPVSNQNVLPSPAECLMAIRECRAALSVRSSDPSAFYILSVAYRYLMLQEAALLENGGVQATLPLQILRMRQRITALNFAIMTTPPPDSPETRQTLSNLHGELAILYRQREFIDLEMDELERVQELIRPANLSEDDERRLRALQGAVAQFDINLKNLGQERQLSADDRYSIALRQGMIRRAIEELENASREGVSPKAVTARLIDLYCEVGRPDKTTDLVAAVELNDPALGTEPGEGAYRLGLISLLLGDYIKGVALWSQAVHQLKEARVYEATDTLARLIQGEPTRAAVGALNVPRRVNIESQWLYELGLLCLEAGRLDNQTAGDRFVEALRLSPDLSTKPVAVYYLDKLGMKVPSADSAESSASTKKEKSAGTENAPSAKRPPKP